MTTTKTPARLERAKQYLAIAESDNSKREAYRQAAEEIAAHIEATGDKQRFVATKLGRDDYYVSRLLKWRKAGYPEDTTPFTMADGDGPTPTDRAATSHTRQVLRDRPAEVADEIAVAIQKPEVRSQVISAMSATERAQVAREILQDEAATDELGEQVADDIPTRARLTHAIDRADDRRATPPPPKPDQFASHDIERLAGKSFFALKDMISHMKDVAYEPSEEYPDYLEKMLDQVIEAAEFAKNLLKSGEMVSDIEEWLANVE